MIRRHCERGKVRSCVCSQILCPLSSTPSLSLGILSVRRVPFFFADDNGSSSLLFVSFAATMKPSSSTLTCSFRWCIWFRTLDPIFKTKSHRTVRVFHDRAHPIFYKGMGRTYLMNKIRFASLALAVLTTACGQPDGLSSPGVERALERIRPEAIEAHMAFLADDLLEGRETGTRGYDLGAKYVAATFQAMGLKPGGSDGTYFQNVPLRSIRLDPSVSSVTLWRNGWTKTLRSGRDYVVSPSATSEQREIRAPLVFVGFGVTAPELDYDDYAAVDAEGKIAVTLSGAPASFPSNQRAYYSGTAKAKNAAAHGVVGILTILTPEDQKRRPWARMSRFAGRIRMRWLDGNGVPANVWPQLKGGATLRPLIAEKLFSNGPASLKEVFAAAESGSLKSFALPLEAEIRTTSSHAELESPNVLALLEGSDPELKDEYLVYSAHLDHNGLGEPVDGDEIWNGAYDNASGTAMLLVVAQAFINLPVPPKRSILFLATTAEEKGLLGADYFTINPTVPKDAIVANLNMDGALMVYPIKDLVIYGSEHSSLGDAFERAAARMDVELSPDPIPEETVFIRSDQFPFVRQGIPAAYAFVGLQTTDPDIDAEAAFAEWLATRYHTPKDDMNQKMHFESGARYAAVNFLAGYLVAQDPERPAWYEDDFFGDKFGSKRKTASAP